jgi:hypothetical protein
MERCPTVMAVRFKWSKRIFFSTSPDQRLKLGCAEWSRGSSFFQIHVHLRFRNCSRSSAQLMYFFVGDAKYFCRRKIVGTCTQCLCSQCSILYVWCVRIRNMTWVFIDPEFLCASVILGSTWCSTVFKRDIEGRRALSYYKFLMTCYDQGSKLQR